MNILKATRRYEEWLGRHTKLVKSDLRLKHQRMAEAVFPFMRATFYRWMQVWPELCPDLARAPKVLAVGDLHVENFGIWRDAEGRLVWGVNDFDEAAVLPYTIDLVRLATSAVLAISAGHLALKEKAACEAVLEGYRQSVQEQGNPFVLEEENGWLRQIATSELRDPVHFWRRMDDLPYVRAMPGGAANALDRLQPERGLKCRFARRVAGLGSLGHQRFVAVTEYCGGRIAREAKALPPSAAGWAQAEGSDPIMYQAIIRGAVRNPDPYVRVFGRWIVRRLSPHCSRIELNQLPRNRDELRLLSAMGWETANVHLGSRKQMKKVRSHLETSKLSWLLAAAKDMARAVSEDQRVWSKAGQA